MLVSGWGLIALIAFALLPMRWMATARPGRHRGGGEHVWNTIFSHLEVLQQDTQIAHVVTT